MKRYIIKGFCCTTGNCGTCNGGYDKDKRKVVVITHRESREHAEEVARNWRAYEPFIEEAQS